MDEEGRAAKSGTKDPLSLITDDHVREALRTDKGGEAQMQSWTIKNFTQKGDNIATVVTSVLVEYTQDSESHQVSYIVKLNPCIDTTLTGLLMNMVFEKEVTFYDQIVPDLNTILINVGQEALRVPKLFHSSQEYAREIIILEDLRPRGFIMNDRNAGLEEAHVRLLLKELSRLHASSFLLQAKAPHTNLTQKYQSLEKDWLLCTGDDKEKLGKLLSGTCDNAAVMLKSWGRHKAAAWIEQILPICVDTLQEQLSKIPPFEVICHGDCWNNNVLFRLDATGAPMEVMLLDHQIVRVASPATDLTYLLYTSVTGHVRRANLEDFLTTYYNSFSSIVKAGGAEMPFTMSQFRQEFKNKMKYGLMFCLMILPYLVGGSTNIPSPEEFLNENSKEILEAWRQGLSENIQNNPRVECFLATIDDMVEAGVIV